ncbi:GGDEF domain-containing protein [Salipiger mucosus]|uniref:Sensory box/GGDEF family protein n=1 Tax=Salipiger mucosus DSM 16094 TaxID=1123237 RepID=S9QVJ3_9RHOB|nr:GGDEF domain-containing protein [Salipiger mucosus]EPX85446.1 Sensory box/GGDEF family protein [Salipiger mucosus DSM 16094]
MSLPPETLDALCPMHLHLDSEGIVRGAGPTFAKLMGDGPLAGAHFTTLFHIYRPGAVRDSGGLLSLAGRRLQLRLHDGRSTALKGLAMPDGAGGVIMNLSFGIGVVDAVRDHALTSTDFAVTDLAIDMLYLVEAKSAAMEASRTLNRRLQGAMLAAERRAYTDPLTGLANRRALTRVLARLQRDATAFALMHIDLDFFKQANDTHGHPAGDRVLQAVADIMLEATRKNDTVARVGGDEFVILLEDLTEPQVLCDLAGRMIRQIERPIPLDDAFARISASIGIALSDGMPPASAVLDRADAALYEAKRRGRAQYAMQAETAPPAGS